MVVRGAGVEMPAGSAKIDDLARRGVWTGSACAMGVDVQSVRAGSQPLGSDLNIETALHWRERHLSSRLACGRQKSCHGGGSGRRQRSVGIWRVCHRWLRAVSAGGKGRDECDCHRATGGGEHEMRRHGGLP